MSVKSGKEDGEDPGTGPGPGDETARRGPGLRSRLCAKKKGSPPGLPFLIRDARVQNAASLESGGFELIRRLLAALGDDFVADALAFGQ